MRPFDRAVLWAQSPAALWTMRSWAFLEAIVWFILPDYLLLLLALLTPARWLYWLRVTWLASLSGSVVMLLLCKWESPWVSDWLFNIPFTHTGMLGRVPELQWAPVLAQPFSGIPAKVWVFSMGEQPGFQAMIFLILMALARGMRMGIVASGGAWVGKRYPLLLQQHGPILWLVYTALFLYGLFKTAYA